MEHRDLLRLVETPPQGVSPDSLIWRGWMEGVRAMLSGEGLLKPFSRPDNSELQPLVGEFRILMRSLDAERRLADDATVTWSPDSLRSLLHKQLAGERVIVV